MTFRHLGIPLLSLVALLAGDSCLAEPPKVDERIVVTATRLRDRALADGTRAYDIVHSLTTEVGPRPAGSPGDRAAVAWGVAKLKELGFANVRAEKVMVPHWRRGANVGRIVAPWPQEVAVTALGGSVATPAGGLQAEVVRFASLDELNAATPEQLKGKIAFVDKKMERARDGSGYGATVRARGAGPSAAASKGAIGFLLRSVGTDSNRLPHTGATRYDEAQPKIPAAAISVPDADLLADELASGKPVRFYLQLETEQLAEEESGNVIGEIPGQRKAGQAEEFVVLGCHLDSWDLGTGALDDGAGCGIVIETARQVAALPLEERPWRTLRVVLFANEEFGLSGARAYAETHKDELARHAAVAEADLGDGPPHHFSTHVAAAALPAVDELAKKLLGPLNIERGDNESFGGADLGPLAPAGVPAISFEQDASTYFDIHHSANDTIDKVSAKRLDQNVAAWSAMIYALAASDLVLGPAAIPEEGATRRR